MASSAPIRRRNADYDAVARQKDRGVEFLRRIGNDRSADALDDESVDHYALRKGLLLDNPRATGNKNYSTRTGARVGNAGTGELFSFHGAFTTKKDAQAREAKTPGSFVRPMYFRSGMRYAVVTPRAHNPKTTISAAEAKRMLVKAGYGALSRAPDATRLLSGHTHSEMAAFIKQLDAVNAGKRNPMFSSPHLFSPRYHVRKFERAEAKQAAQRAVKGARSKAAKLLAGARRGAPARGVDNAALRAEVESALRNLGYKASDAKARAAQGATKASDFDGAFRIAMGSRNPVYLSAQDAINAAKRLVKKKKSGHYYIVRDRSRRGLVWKVGNMREAAYDSHYEVDDEGVRLVAGGVLGTRSFRAAPSGAINPRKRNSLIGVALVDAEEIIEGAQHLPSGRRRHNKREVRAGARRRNGFSDAIVTGIATGVADHATRHVIHQAQRRKQKKRRRNALPTVVGADGVVRIPFNVTFRRGRKLETWQRYARTTKEATTDARRALRTEFPDGNYTLLSIKPAAVANPNSTAQAAADLYQRFHGKASAQVTEVLEGAGVSSAIAKKIAKLIPPEDRTKLGDLVALQIGGYEIGFQYGERPVLASNPDGTQLFFIGGNQDVRPLLKQLNKDSTKLLVDLGECKQVEYHTRKAMDNFNPVTYYHRLGEDTGERPRMMFDTEQRQLFLVGGAYQVKPEGIVN